VIRRFSDLALLNKLTAPYPPDDWRPSTRRVSVIYQPHNPGATIEMAPSSGWLPATTANRAPGGAEDKAEQMVNHAHLLTGKEKKLAEPVNGERVGRRTAIDGVGRESPRMHRPGVSARGPQCMRKVQDERGLTQHRSKPRPLPPAFPAE
jgi:hypothetical protein